jgi:phytoene synthase
MSSALVLPAVRGASPDADVAECRRILAAGSKSFALAGQALPAEARDAAAALYAFCRVADDLVDLGDDPRAAIEVLSTRLDGIYAGHPADDPVDRAFARVVHAYQVPRAILDALIEGFVWDAERRRYDTLSEVVAYGVRVASTVGLAMTLLLRRRAPVTLARAADLGIAMQLTNIARDVGEDARNGRLYLPRAWLEAEGVDPAVFLSDPRPSPGLARVVAKLLEVAEGYYRRADAGIPELPRRTRWAIRAARLIYADIGRVIARRGFDSVTTRAVVSTPRKLWLLARASAALVWGAPPDRSPPDPEARVLVEAVR